MVVRKPRGPTYFRDGAGGSKVSEKNRESEKSAENEHVSQEYFQATLDEAYSGSELTDRFQSQLNQSFNKIKKKDCEFHPTWESFVRSFAKSRNIKSILHWHEQKIHLPHNRREILSQIIESELRNYAEINENFYPKSEKLQELITDILKGKTLSITVLFYFAIHLINHVLLAEDLEEEQRGIAPKERAEQQGEAGRLDALPPRPKVNMAFGIDPALKAAVMKAAQEQGISAAEWMSQAVTLKFEAEERDLSALMREFENEADASSQPLRPHRTRRARENLPDPTKPPNASVNQRGNPVSLRVSPELLEEIDESVYAIRDMDRTNWFADAIQKFFDSDAPLPEDHGERIPLTRPIMMRLEPELIERMDQAAKDAKVTRSDWMRRIARWRLDTASPAATPDAAPIP